MTALAARRRRGALAALLLGAGATVACARAKAPPVGERDAVLDSAESVIFGVHTNLVTEGVRRSELFGDTVYQFDQGSRMEVKGVRANFYTDAGALQGTLTSRAGTYNTRSGFLEARDAVTVVTTDGRKLTTPQLRYLIPQNLVESDSSFVLTRPGERLTGVGFSSDPDLRNIRILNTTSARGGVLTLPNP